jgi:opacity protein-like surface antigen
MKKILVLLIITMVTVVAFAQENDQNSQFDWRNNRRMAITMDPYPLITGTRAGGFGLGLGFEYAFSPEIAAKAQLHYLGYNPEIMFGSFSTTGNFTSSFRFAAEGRWYPMQNHIRGVFANGGLQIQGFAGSFSLDTYSWEQDEVTDTYNRILIDSTTYNNGGSLGFYAGLGYKFTIGRAQRSLVIEPALDYVWSLRFGDWSSNFQPGFYNYNRTPFDVMGTHGFRFTVNLGIAF